MINIALLFTHGVSLENWVKSGILNRELKYYNFLSKYNYNINFLTYGGIKDKNILTTKDKINILYSDFKSFNINENYKFIRIIFQILFIVKASKGCDIIKTNQLKASLPAIFLKIIFGKPFYLRIGYEPFLNRIIGGKKNFIKDNFIYCFSFISYHLSDIISVTNLNQKEFIIKKYGINNKKIHLLPNWIDHNIFKNNGNKNDCNNILFVGRLEHEKNPLLLLDALIKLKVNGTFIGKGSLSNRMKQIIINNNLQDKIRIIDFVPNEELPNFYNKYSITALISEYEGQPKSILEAMSCESCILASDVPGLNSLIINEVNGVLTPLNLESICLKLRYLIKSPEKRKLLGINARKTILRNHLLENIIQKEIKILKNIKN